MIINTIIPLEKISDFPSRQVGKKALEFAKINHAKVKIADCFVIPTETFRQIAHHNNLLEKIKLLEDTNDWNSELLEKKYQEKISKLIKQQEFPEEISKDIIHLYNKFIKKNSFIKISSGRIIQENISGEANLLESILEVWSRSSTGSTLFKKPQIITIQSQPIVSGIVKPNLDKKNRYIIKSAYGVYDKKLGLDNKPDSFEIDSINKTIITRFLNHRKIELKRKLDGYQKIKSKKVNLASLSDQQAIQVAIITEKINRLFIGSRIIYFDIIDKQVIVTDLIEFTKDDQTKSSTDPILIGQSITGGYVEGYAQIVRNQTDSINFPIGNILVKKSLTHLDLNLVNQASAIVLEEKQLTPVILKTIQDSHIPCITGVIYATSRLRTGQKIVIDSGLGQIFIKDEKTTQPKHRKTLTKIYLSAGNPFRTDQYLNHNEGIFLKSDYAIAFMGVHPNHLLQNRDHLLEKNLTKTIESLFTKNQKDLFYRSCNLNSSELSSLNNSLNYENQELNPYLGTRGALKTIEDSLLFETELKIVSKFAHEQKREVNFVIPFIRTVTELAIIFKIIEKTIPKNSYVKFWLQLNTPANVLNLNEYLHLPISGVTFQAKTIHDLTYGLDPDNPNLLSHYTFDSSLATLMLEVVVRTINESKSILKNTIGQLPVIVKMNQFDTKLVESATKLGVRAIVVKPVLLDIVKQQIISTEDSLILGK